MKWWQWHWAQWYDKLKEGIQDSEYFKLKYCRSYYCEIYIAPTLQTEKEKINPVIHIMFTIWQ